MMVIVHVYFHKTSNSRKIKKTNQKTEFPIEFEQTGLGLYQYSPNGKHIC